MSGETNATSAKSEITFESLQKEIELLRNQLTKTAHVVAQTGSQLLALQVEKTRGNLENLRVPQLSLSDKHSRAKSQEKAAVEKPQERNQPPQAPPEHDDLVNALTSEDIVDLVAELQGQLDILDERSVRRTANTFCTEDSHRIAPLPGRDGELPEEHEEFPYTLRDFKEMSTEKLYYWLKWYEILPPDEEEMKQILEHVGTCIEEVGYQPSNNQHDLTGQELDDYYDDLARFLGLRIRRAADVW